MTRLLALLWLGAWVAGLCTCAHRPRSTGMSGLKSAAETFHERLRWRDYRGAAELIVSERRVPFVRARELAHDDENLTITDYQLEDIKLEDKDLRGKVVSKLRWTRLPSVTEESATVTSEFVFREGAWFLQRQTGGPFAPELP